MEHNAVKSPKHYTEGRCFEPKDVIRDWGLNFNLGSALKYIARAGRKGDIVEDLEKAMEYLSFEIEAFREDAAIKRNEEKLRKAEEGATYSQVSQHTKSEAVKGVEGAKVGVIELVVPKDMPMEAVIQMAIKKIMGAEE